MIFTELFDLVVPCLISSAVILKLKYVIAIEVQLITLGSGSRWGMYVLLTEKKLLLLSREKNDNSLRKVN